MLFCHGCVCEDGGGVGGEREPALGSWCGSVSVRPSEMYLPIFLSLINTPAA